MNPVQDRDLNHLHPIFRVRLEGWLTAVRTAGLSLTVYETFRTAARQAYLYEQGRTRPGAIVTYTLDSLHRYGCAADLAPVVSGAMTWDQAAYDHLYTTVPLAPFGLENLSFERPHVQVIGGVAAARKLGIVRDVLVGSVWPLPAKKTPTPAQAAPASTTPPPLGTLILQDLSGRDVQFLDQRAVYGGVQVERIPGGVRLSRSGQ